MVVAVLYALVVIGVSLHLSGVVFVISSDVESIKCPDGIPVSL